MDGLEKLLAIEEIKALKARRCRAVDDKDWDLYRACHTADSKSYWRDDGSAIVGNEAMTQSVLKATEGKTTVHHVHTPEITLTSATTADGTWAMEDMLWWEENGVPHWTHGYGRYFETYEKVGDTWLIASRRLVRTRVDNGTGAKPDAINNGS